MTRGNSMRWRQRSLLLALAACLTTVGVLLGLGIIALPSGQQPSETQRSAAGTSNETSKPNVGSGPAGQSGPHVLAVKIDNVRAARPPVGLAAAEVVYVEPVEGGLTRLIAVYGENKPEVVGPVRSLRETDLHLLAQYGHPALSFSGAAPELKPQIKASPIRNVSQNKVPRAYFRDSSRSAPHNLFVRPDRLPPGGRWAPQARPDFGPAPEGGDPTKRYSVQYGQATVGFEWSAAQQRWLISMNGHPLKGANSGRLTASTVVVQRVEVTTSPISDAAGNPSPVAHTVGKGQARILRNGKAYEAVWSRPTVRSATAYTTPSGEPIPFAPGPIWIVLAPR